MAKKPSANADPSVAPKEKRARRPAEVINLPLRGEIISLVKGASAIYKVRTKRFLERFTVGVEPMLKKIALDVIDELKAEQDAKVETLFATAETVVEETEPKPVNEPAEEGFDL